MERIVNKRTQVRGVWAPGAQSIWSTVLKILVLGMVNALALWALPVLLGDRQHVLLTGLIVAVAGIDYVFLSRRAYPLRFLLPGLFFMIMMIVYPIGYTVYVSFTNYGGGHILSKQMTIDHYTAMHALKEDSPAYPAQIFISEDRFAVILTSPNGEAYVGCDGRLEPLGSSSLKPVDDDGDGTYDRLGGFRRLGGLEVFQFLGKLQNLSFQSGSTVLKMRDPESFAAYIPQYRYDADQDALIDMQSGVAYRADNGSFVSAAGEALETGYRTAVGWRNFIALVTNKRIANPFFRVFSWTIIWAFLSVLTTFVIGFFLAMLLNDPRLRLRGVYRVLLIIPYALPAFISALIWRGFFNTEVGLVNSLLGVAIPWLQHPVWAKVALIIVNLWLGFPYMMIVSLGALQSIPGELYEAARVDGASGWQQLWRITLPLLLVSVAPLLIASFAYNFNNFTVIYLVTEGRPAIPGALTPTGATDILISYTYRMAFARGNGGDYGLASAVSILIFLIVGAISWFNFRFTGALEEVREDG